MSEIVDHYDQAERYLLHAESMGTSSAIDERLFDERVALAQVHATLALAAASRPVEGSIPERPRYLPLRDAFPEVVIYGDTIYDSHTGAPALPDDDEETP